eukprot:3245052-Ditylum_brightwellii.AAC.1
MNLAVARVSIAVGLQNGGNDSFNIAPTPNMEEYLKEKDDIIFKRRKTEVSNEFKKKAEKGTEFEVGKSTSNQRCSKK